MCVLFICGSAALGGAFFVWCLIHRKGVSDSPDTAENFTGLPESDELLCPVCGRLTPSASRYCVRCWEMIR